MQINSIRLRNIGPHREFSVELGRGLIGVIGSNGAGKSTLINSVYAALTNDFSRFSSVKSDIIRNGSGTEQSFIQLEGVHRGQDFCLTRYLRPNKNEFRIGTRKYTKASDVNDAVTAELNITKDVIDKYVFVDQWQMFGFLDETAAERAKTFQFLCGTEIASRIHKVCTDYVMRQQGIEIIDNSVELEEIISEAETRMAENKKAGKEAESVILSEEAANEFRKVIGAYEAARLARDTQATVQVNLRKCRLELKTIRDACVEKERQLQRRETWLKNNEERVVEAKAVQRTAAVRARMLKILQESTAVLEETEKNLAGLQKLVPASNYILPGHRITGLSSERECNRLRSLVESAAAAEIDGAVCEHCQQPISETHREKIRKAQEANLSRLNALQAALDYSVQFDAERENQSLRRVNWETAVVRETDKITTAKQSLAELSSSEAFSPEEAQTLVAKFFEISGSRLAMKGEVERLRERVDAAKQRVSRLQEQLKTCQETIEAGPSDETLKQAVDLLEVSKRGFIRRAESLGAFREAKNSKARATETLRQLKLRLAEKSKIRNLLETISAVGEVFHWNQLPKAVSQANLELLVGDINANLSLFNDPFVVEADSDLTFKVFMPGQQPVKARQLSGGQKVILAIAFRAALDRVFGHDVGMMFLDEPTAGLDADNVNFFHEALQQLAQKVGQERQLVVVTHVNELSSVFAQLVEVKKG